MFNGGIRGKRANDNQGTVNPQSKFVQSKNPQPYISGYTINGTDDTALDPAGGQTVLVNGTGFASGVSATLSGTQISVVTLVSPTQISFTSPAKSAGSYSLVVYNSTGGAAILVPGLTYSSVPTYTTAAGSIGSYYETTAINTSVVATSDSAITYSLSSGSLPSGATLSSGGVITGTSPVDSGSTTYTFAITATDAELQDVTRTFTLTINTDVVSWSSPANNTAYSVNGGAAIANVTMSATSAAGYGITYTANALPTGLSISGANIAGTPTTAQTVTTLLTATAATTNRTATRTISWTVTLNDTYFQYVSLLLNGEITNTSFINDASTNSFGLTIQGDTKPVLFNPYQGDGYYSNYFDGSGDYLSLTNSVAVGSGSFTIEAWLYPTATPSINAWIYGYRNGGDTSPYFFINSSRQPVFGGDTTTYITSSTALPLNTWSHVVVVRNGSAMTMYVNGASAGTTTSSQNFSYTGANNIGFANGANSYYWTGYISNFRIVVGTAVYTSAFTPPTTPLTAITNTSLLTCQSNRFIDNSTNNFTITKVGDTTISPAIPFTANSSYSTYGSTYFDGSGDYLTIPNSSAFALPGDFTIECWVYMTTVQTCVFAGNINTSGYGDWAFFYNSASGIRFLTGNSTVVITGTYTMPANTWVHCAISRSGSSVKIFANGVLLSTTTDSNSNPFAGTMQIGRSNDGGMYLVGYLSDVRIVKGTAVYTSAFTPPTTLLTAITNTQLLTLQYNGGANNYGIIDNSPFNNIITRSGNATQGSFSPYAQTGYSVYFNGSTDYLSLPTTGNLLDWGVSANYTIEAWVFPTSFIGQAGILSRRAAGGASTDWTFYYTSSAVVLYNYGTTITATSTLTLNQWNHVALSIANGTLRIFLNGVLISTPTSISASNTNQATTYIIGQQGSTSNMIAGYLSNLRVTNSALYTTAFTPSTTPLTAIANTSLLTCQSNRFIDNSPNNLALTTAGTPSIQALSPFGSIREATPISYSNYFDGVSDGLLTSSGFAIGSSDFTIEFWVNYTDTTTDTNDRRIISQGASSSTTALNISTLPSTTSIGGTSQPAGSIYFGGSNYWIGTNLAINDGAWHHIAFTRQSGTTRCFVDGVLKQTVSTSYTLSASTAYALGYYITGGITTGNWNGYISNLRIVVGTSLYNAGFTPPTTPLTAIANTSLLTCQSTTIIDNSTNAFTITASGDTKPSKYNPFGYTAQTYASYSPSVNGGSVYFDGTGDYLQIANSPLHASLSNNDFTIECWFYHTSMPAAAQYILSHRVGAYVPFLFWTSSGSLLLYVSSNNSSWDIINNQTLATLITGQWYHLAYTRSGSTFKVFLNGVQVFTFTSSATFTATSNPLNVGASSTDTNSPFFGYITDIRMIRGLSLYNSNFVPPTQTLTTTVTSGSSTYNAVVLLNNTNAGIVDQHSSNVLETVGNTQISTSVKKYNNGSIYFDGSGDYLNIPYSQLFNFGTGDFTVECWANITYVQYSGIISAMNSTITSSMWLLGYSNSGHTMTFGMDGSGNAICGADYTSYEGTWTHIAACRSGSTLKLFFNGTQVQSVTNSTSFTGDTANPVTIGRRYNNQTQYYMSGYIDDLRITKGYARYTSNFTAPTGAFVTK